VLNKVTVLVKDEVKQVMYKTEISKVKLETTALTFKQPPEKCILYIYATRKFTAFLIHAA
jgi:hypothetical protein